MQLWREAACLGPVHLEIFTMGVKDLLKCCLEKEVVLKMQLVEIQLLSCSGTICSRQQRQSAVALLEELISSEG